VGFGRRIGLQSTLACNGGQSHSNRACRANCQLASRLAMLDLFSMTNAPVQGRVTSTAMSRISPVATTPQRITPLQGVLTAITAGNAMGFASDQATISANIYTQGWANVSATGWAANRSTGVRKFTPGVFNMIGELCEIDKICTQLESVYCIHQQICSRKSHPQLRQPRHDPVRHIHCLGDWARLPTH